MEQFGIFVAYRCCVGLLRLLYYGSNIFIQLLCNGEPLCHYYTDNVMCRQGCEALSLYSELQSTKNQRLQKISLYLLGYLMKKNQRHKNPCQRGTNYISKKFCPTWAEFSKSHFCPSWTEVKGQLRHKLCRSQKSISAQLAEKSEFNFCTGCVEVEFASRQKARH